MFQRVFRDIRATENILTAMPCSLMAKLTMALTDENTRLTDDEDIPRSNKKSLNCPASDSSSIDKLSCPRHSVRYRILRPETSKNNFVLPALSAGDIEIKCQSN